MQCGTINRGRLMKEKEEIKLDVSISIGQNIISNLSCVSCLITLPIRSTDPIEIILKPKPPEDDFDDFSNRIPFEFSIYGEIKDPNGKIEKIVKIKKAYLNKVENIRWSNENETYALVEPNDLEITEPLDLDNNSNKALQIGIFYLTPCSLLKPLTFLTYFPTGEVKIKREKNFEFTFNKDLKMVFTHHYKYYKKNEGDDEIRSFYELVAEFEINNNHSDFVPPLEVIDDFLLLTSFAARHRCICTGWEIHRPQNFIRYFRKDLILPKNEIDIPKNMLLIQKWDFDQFMKLVYPRFIEMGKNDLIRSAIYECVQTDSILASDFLRLFSSLESLVLFFRQENGFENIFCDKEWDKFEKEVKRIVGNGGFSLSEEKRGFLSEKLIELNRVPFSAAFKKFCDYYNIDLSDLWPVVDGGNNISLAKIRNVFAHGDTFPIEQSEALITALLNLKTVVERAILSMLGWSWEKSGAHKQTENHYWETMRNLKRSGPKLTKTENLS